MTISLWRKILSYPWSSYNELNQELIDTLLKKAQNSSIEDLIKNKCKNFYYILYSFFVQRSDFQNGITLSSNYKLF